MRFFYFYKSAQILMTVLVLARIFLTSELCTAFMPAKLLEQQLNDDACKNMAAQIGQTRLLSSVNDDFNVGRDTQKFSNKTTVARFFGSVLDAWSKLMGYDEFHDDVVIHSTTTSKAPLDENAKRYHRIFENTMHGQGYSKNKMSLLYSNPKVEDSKPNTENASLAIPTAEIGTKQCVKVAFSDFFGFGGNIGPVKEVLRHFAIPIYCLVAYLFVVLVHTCVQEDWPYGICAMMMLLSSATCWLFVLMAMLTIDYNWHDLWVKTEAIQPDVMGAISTGKIVSSLMVLLIVSEGVFSKCLGKNVQIKRLEARSNVEKSSALNDHHEQFLPTKDWMDRRTNLGSSIQISVPVGRDQSVFLRGSQA